MISAEDKVLVVATASDFRERILRHHEPGFGIFPSADPNSNYFNQVWARDAAHAGANYFVHEFPNAAIDSLATLLRHQRPNGSLPSRVEREYQVVKFTPGLRYWSKPIFKLIRRGKEGLERAVHEGTDFAGGEDTIPVTLIVAGELFRHSEPGRIFVTEHFNELKKAAEFFLASKVDSGDHLAVAKLENPDWADTIKRKGKLGGLNVWWARGLRSIADIAEALHDSSAGYLKEESEKTRSAVLLKLYYKEEREVFFRAEVNDDRLDTVASIFGSLYFLSPDEAFLVEQTLKRRVGHGSGLQNFDPSYAQKDIFWAHRLAGQWLYHNKFVWPWVTLQNIQVKIKIGFSHSEEGIRKQFHEEALDDLVKMAKMFQEAGGAYEVFEPDVPRRGETRFYRPPQYFMGTMVSYLGVFGQLKKLNWL